MTDHSGLRVGVVGCGNIGHHHGKYFDESPATLAGGVDASEAARERFAREFDTTAYEDPQRMYDAVDAVVVATPNSYHEEYAVSALEAGLDVLVEKPLAHTLTAAERVADAASGADGFCMLGFHTRFEPEVEVLTSYREAGRFGEVTHVEASYLRRRGVPGRGSWFTQADVAGGGALIDIGVHALDLSLYLLDYPDVESVSGVTRSQFGGREDYSYLDMWGVDQGPEKFDVDDSATALVRCAGDRTISLEVAWAANRPSKQEYVLRGDDGGATYDRGEGALTVHETRTAGGVHMSDDAIETPDENAHAAEMDYFLDHVAGGNAPERNTVEQGLAVQRVIDAVYTAGDTGRAVEF